MGSVAGGYMATTCTHKTIYDHTEGHDADGRWRWRCTHCKKVDRWSETWGYHGNVECLHCSLASIDTVACSDACRDALIEAGLMPKPPSKPAPRAKDPDAGKPSAPAPHAPASRRATAQREARKREALAALEALSAEDRIEVLHALSRSSGE